MSFVPVLLIQGGSTNLTQFPRQAETAESIQRIVEDAGARLDRGASALEAVARAVELLEADPLYNAGYGSKLQSDGIPRLSASAMDGRRRRFGAVINVQDVCHPSALALHLLEAEDRVLDGTGAHDLARELRMPRRSPLTEARFEQWKEAHIIEPYGTVGAVALDAEGNLAAITSTGGKGHERPGRVSDSALPSGNYADATSAISCTGIGEHILESAVAPRLAATVEAGSSLVDAAERMMAELTQEQRELGFIAVDREGTAVARCTTRYMVYRIWRNGVIEGWPSR